MTTNAVTHSEAPYIPRSVCTPAAGNDVEQASDE